MRIAMSAIVATGSSSGYSAVAQLLANSVSSATADIPQNGQSGASGSSATPTSGPSDSLNLSDHAKAVLARAQTDQIAAGELQTFLQSVRNPNGTGTAPASKPTSDGVTQIFDQLTGHTQAPNQSLDDFFTAQFTALEANARQPDGTIGNYSETFNDISFAPTTPEAINNWYQNDGQAAVQGAPQIAQQAPDSPQAINAASLAQAVENHAVTFLNAFDIPGLDFHNSLTIQGGEDGGGSSWSVTYNHDAAIFNDPTTSYAIGGNGTVISWKNTAPSDAASS
jgi:hypothetical protein